MLEIKGRRKKNTKIRRGTNQYRIIKYLAAGGGIMLISMVSPLGGASIIRELLRGYFRRKSFERQRFLNDLKHLQARELIDYRESGDGTVRIVIKQAGREKALAFQLDDLEIKKPAKWDRKWRLIIFDIPVNKKQARDAFGRKLRSLNFYPLQKSVYLTPFPCEDEIEFLAAVFDIREHVLILYVSEFEGQEKLMHHFNLL